MGRPTTTADLVAADGIHAIVVFGIVECHAHGHLLGEEPPFLQLGNRLVNGDANGGLCFGSECLNLLLQFGNLRGRERLAEFGEAGKGLHGGDIFAADHGENRENQFTHRQRIADALMDACAEMVIAALQMMRLLEGAGEVVTFLHTRLLSFCCYCC